MGKEWDLRLWSPELKEKQTKLQERMTEIFDAVNELKEEMELISAVWKGDAKEVFHAAFIKELSEVFRCTEEMGKMVDMLALIENSFENCEAQISAIIN